MKNTHLLDTMIKANRNGLNMDDYELVYGQLILKGHIKQERNKNKPNQPLLQGKPVSIHPFLESTTSDWGGVPEVVQNGRVDVTGDDGR